MLKKLALAALFAVSAFGMHSAEVNINDTDLEVSGKLDIGQFNANVEPNTTFLGFRVINADNTHGSDNGYNNEPYYEVNFLMKKPFSDTGLSLGMGVKVNFTKDFSSLPLGLEATYKLPTNNKFVPMFLNGSVYYGPKVLSFGDADRYYDYRVSYDVEIINNGRVTLGYRSLNTNYSDVRDDYIYNKSFYIGFKFLF